MTPAPPSSRPVIACDRCKSKKRKCIREAAAADEPCVRCTNRNIACTTTLEREEKAGPPSLSKRVQQLEHQLLVAQTALPTAAFDERDRVIGSSSSSLVAHPNLERSESTSGQSEQEIGGVVTSPQSWTIQRVSKAGIDEFHAVTNYPLDLDSTLNGIRADLMTPKDIDLGRLQRRHGGFGPAVAGEDAWTSSREEPAHDEQVRTGKRRRLDDIGMQMGFQSGPISDPEYRGPHVRIMPNELFGLPARPTTIESLISDILNDIEIEDSYRQFFDHLNPYIAILDPVLHTSTYCSKTSPVLHLAILATAALVFRPQCHSRLLHHTNVLFGEAFMTGLTSVGLCQALSITSIWKEPSDNRQWLRVGYAIRAAYELGLDAKPARPLPLDQQAAREQLNKERTFRQLALFDRTLFDLNGRAHRMISPETIIDLPEWMRDHPTVFCYSDSMLCASVPHGEAITQILYGSHLDVDGKTSNFIAANIQADLRTWQKAWLGETPPAALHPVSRCIIGFYSLTNEFEIVEWMTRTIAFRNKAVLIPDLLSRATNVLRYTASDLNPAGVLRSAPDILTFKIAKAAFLLVKRLPEMTNTMARETIDLLLDVNNVYQQIANVNQLTEQTARFYDRIAGIVRSRADQVFAPDINMPFHECSSGQQTVEMNEPGPGHILTADTFGTDWDGALQEFVKWLPDHFLPDVNDFDWLGDMPRAG